MAVGFFFRPGQTYNHTPCKMFDIPAKYRSSGQPKTDIVVPVVSVVPVAAGNPTMLFIIVPRTATQHGISNHTHRKGGYFEKNFSASPKEKKKKDPG